MLRFLTAGESHGPCLTAIVEGLPAGLAVDVEAINRDLARRQGGYGRGARMKIEQDRVEVLGGVIAGQTTGAPVALRVENRDWANWRDRWAAGDLPRLSVPRPGHADYAGMVKYVEIGSGGATVPDLPLEELWALAEASDVRCPDEQAAGRMRAAIDTARQAGDSLGGIFVVVATGIPVGLGSHVHWERRLDARLAAAVMSIPAIKGVEIGPAFENARRPGTQVHDEFEQVSESANQRVGESASLQVGKSATGRFVPVTRTSNRAGGIEGGMSNGQPIVVRAAMKPIPTTVTPLRSVDLATGKPAETQYQRSDVCAVPAASVVGEAMVAWVLAGALIEKLGGDSLAEMRERMG